MIRSIRRPAAAGLAAAVLGVPLVAALAAPADATAAFTFTRVAGDDRYATAAKLAASFATPTTVLLANGQDANAALRIGEHFPDALAASYLAGDRSAPILLTTEQALPKATTDALAALKPKNVIIIGGTAAVSAGQEQQLTAAGYLVTRIAGNDRYETAQMVAMNVPPTSVGSVDGKRTAVVASGTRFPDALVSGPLGYAAKFPIALTLPDRLPQATQSELTTNNITNVLIAGGTGVVRPEVEAQLKAMNISVTRLAGDNRSATAAIVAEYSLTKLGFDAATIDLATGGGFADALTGGPYAGRTKTSILLTENAQVLGGAEVYLRAHANTLTSGTIFGGIAAVAPSTEAAAQAAARSAAGTTTPDTARPELVSAAVVVDSDADRSKNGVRVDYTFDAAVTGAAVQASGFHVATFDNARTTAASGNVALQADNRTVRVTYPSITASTAVSALSVATVSSGAVTGNNALTNPDGDAAIATSARTSTSGLTKAPDLISVGNFVSSSTSTATTVDFRFDAAAYSQGQGTGYHLVTTAGAQVDCTGPTQLTATASTTITVTCSTSAATNASGVARGYVDAGTVSTTQAPGGTTNPLEAVDVSANGNTTGSLDLVSASFAAGAGANDPDTVTYTFDAPVVPLADVPTTPTTDERTAGFRVYTSDATEVGPTAGAVTKSTTDSNALVVSYAHGALANAVGASVRAKAVQSPDGTQTNQADSVTVATAASVPAGRTTAPDLVSVAVSSNGQAVYTFDQSLDLRTMTAGSFRLYQRDGTALTCTAASNPDTASATVVCTQFQTGSGASATTADAATVRAAVLATVAFAAVGNPGTTSLNDSANAQANQEGASAITVS